MVVEEFNTNRANLWVYGACVLLFIQEKNGSSPPSSPVDNVYLTGEFIYNDVWSGWRCGGPMADTDPEKKKEKKDKESEEKEGSAAQAKGSEASTTKPDTKEEVSVLTKTS